ncbi:MAG: GGDEF domain-containing protein [Lachnospiraceae bacterium]|nr:GGDEF domain-containing protein [Lachnospiraceae bacterium]
MGIFMKGRRKIPEAGLAAGILILMMICMGVWPGGQAFGRTLPEEEQLETEQPQMDQREIEQHETGRSEPELSSDILKVAVFGELQPISVKEDDRSCSGLAPDILESFAGEHGLSLVYVEAETYEEALHLTRTGVTDVMAVNVEYPNEEDLEQAAPPLLVTEPYLKAQMLVIYQKDADLGKTEILKSAEVAGYPVFSDNPKYSHICFDTPEQCLHAVRSGQADLMYCDIFTGSVYMQQYDNRDLVAFPVETETWFRFGVSEEADQALLGLLNEKIASISRRERNQSLAVSWRMADDDLEDLIYHHPYEIICIVFTVAFLAVVLFATYYRIRSRQNASLQGYAESYHMLADAFGEAGLEYDYIEDCLTVFGANADKLWLPSRIENFSASLGKKDFGVSLTREQFEDILVQGMKGEACEAELECRIKSGEWMHFRMIYTVITTEESYKRPIRLIGCLVSAEATYREREKLRALGLYDRLTGLFNRAGLEQQFEEHRARELDRRAGETARMAETDAGGEDQNGGSRENGGKPGEDVLLLIDVDEFKRFNDTYGHQCGDDVLVYMGRCLKELFRKDDILCRWGGDEFLIYMIGASTHRDVVRRRCRTLQQEMQAYRYEGAALPVTLSIGGAVAGSRSLDEVFRDADQALYIVKKRGRNSICILPISE